MGIKCHIVLIQILSFYFSSLFWFYVTLYAAFSKGFIKISHNFDEKLVYMSQ